MNKTNRLFLKIGWMLILAAFLTQLFGQEIDENERRYIRVGSLQSHVSAWCSERAYNNVYYEGLIWPADYLYQDNAVIKRAWIAAKDYTDEKSQYWEYWATYIALGYVRSSIFPVKLKQTSKIELPIVYVDGNNISAPYMNDYDEINPDQIPDRIVENVVNTSLGLTVTRRFHAFSQQYHDNYFIKEFILTNTGNVDYDEEIELSDSLKGVRIGWGTRYSNCREAGNSTDAQQTWGKFSWITKRGEDYASHVNDVLTEADGPVDWLRCGWSWMGQTERATGYDNIGAPYRTRDGRLTAPQHVGTAVLHVDKGPADTGDDPNQPVILGWHAGDTYPSPGEVTLANVPSMLRVWDYLSGNPYPSVKYGGNDRFWENNTAGILDRKIPTTIHGDGGGTNLWITYGPFNLGPGDSVKIVEVEGINGLSRTMCEVVGRRWKLANADQNDKGPFTLPNGSTTDDEDVYKNTWFYTGVDSILLTFSRAKRNYDNDFNIPQPPLPPQVFNVESGGDMISLSWTLSPSESEPDFAGYKVYRGVAKADTVFDLIADVPKGTTSFNDTNPTRGISYYYYIVACNDGSNNTSGIMNPTGPLHSSRFYTKTNEPAYLRRQAGSALKDIRVVPNPYNVRSTHLQYTGEDDKIMFLNIPGKCRIKIFSERGDLIDTIEHLDGSGDESWNSVSSSRQVVVSGIYIAHFEVLEDQLDSQTGEVLYHKGDSATRKIIIIR